jgi:hypothetical protein
MFTSNFTVVNVETVGTFSDVSSSKPIHRNQRFSMNYQVNHRILPDFRSFCRLFFFFFFFQQQQQALLMQQQQQQQQQMMLAQQQQAMMMQQQQYAMGQPQMTMGQPQPGMMMPGAPYPGAGYPQQQPMMMQPGQPMMMMPPGQPMMMPPSQQPMMHHQQQPVMMSSGGYPGHHVPTTHVVVAGGKFKKHKGFKGGFKKVKFGKGFKKLGKWK